MSLTVVISKCRNMSNQSRFAVKMVDDEGHSAMVVCPTRSHAKIVAKKARVAAKAGTLWEEARRIIIP